LTETIEEVVFDKVNTYAEIAEMAGVPITEKIDYSMLILLRSKQLKSNIKELKKKNIADKT